MKNILITGGAGFIGSNFIRHLLERYDEYAVVNLDKLTYAGNLENLEDVEDHPRYRFVKGDICDRSLVESVIKEHEIDTIVNFAAESHVDRSILGPAPFIEIRRFLIEQVSTASEEISRECRHCRAPALSVVRVP